jgi:hypothetical protein
VDLTCFRLSPVRACVAVLLACAASGCADSTTTSTTAAVAALSTITVSSATVVGGTVVVGIVNLTAAAPTGGAPVTVTSSSTSAVVPATVTVSAGSTSQSFAITTTNLTATATITATYLGVTETATLAVTVVSVPALQNLLLSTSVSAGGLPVQGTITLTAPAPAGGLPVSLTSNSSFATVPATVTVPLGNTIQTFQIATTDSPVATTATITANYAGVARIASFTIGRLDLSVLSGSVPGGLAATGVVTLPGPAPDSGAVVALASNTPNAVVPASVTVPAGATTQTFTISTVNAPPTTTATITATYAGASRTTTLVVIAFPTVVGVSCSTITPQGGTGVQCTGTLSGPAPAGGWRLAFASSDPSVTVPGVVTIPASGVSFQFTLATTTVTAATVVSVEVFDALSGLALWGQILTVSP